WMDQDVCIHHEQVARVRSRKRMDVLIPCVDLAPLGQTFYTALESSSVRVLSANLVKKIICYLGGAVSATIQDTDDLGAQTSLAKPAEYGLLEERLQDSGDRSLLIPRKDRHRNVSRLQAQCLYVKPAAVGGRLHNCGLA